MKKLLLLTALLGLFLTASAQNLVSNGSFTASSMNSFNSGYVKNSNSLWDSGTVGIAAIPHDEHILWASFDDHTTSNSNGKMLLVNGSTVHAIAWSQTITVTPNQPYQFTIYAKSVYTLSPAKLALLVNNVSQQLRTKYDTGTKNTFPGTSVTLSSDISTAGGWTKITCAFASSTSSVTLGIIDSNLAANGNDFAVDDISLSPVATVNLPIKINEITGTPNGEGATINWKADGYVTVNLQYSTDGINWINFASSTKTSGSSYYQFAAIDNYFRIQGLTISDDAEYSNVTYLKSSKAIVEHKYIYYNGMGTRLDSKPTSGEYIVKDLATGAVSHNFIR